jgi:NAD(P)-dependent dehydrogenase (short-subunit alcohol dehydrogenase family)
MRLKNTVAIVTGAGLGIGRQIALTFSEEGAKVVAVDIIQENIDKVVGEIRAKGAEALGVNADVSDSTKVKHAVDETLKAFGRVDILVNNAGIWPNTFLVDLTEQQWDHVVGTDLKGTFNFLKAVLPTMVAQKTGKVVNIASIAGAVRSSPPQSPHAHYAAAKAGVLGLTRAAALELAPIGIRVNAIAPGGMLTPGSIAQLLAAAGKNSMLSAKDPEEALKILKGWGRIVPMRRIGEPIDIAKVALFLASDDSAYVTGQMIVADGGLTLT